MALDKATFFDGEAVSASSPRVVDHHQINILATENKSSLDRRESLSSMSSSRGSSSEPSSKVNVKVSSRTSTKMDNIETAAVPLASPIPELPDSKSTENQEAAGTETATPGAQLNTTTRHLSEELAMEETTPAAAPRVVHRHAPQDRSTVGSSQTHYYYEGEPVSSPPFSLYSPPDTPATPSFENEIENLAALIQSIDRCTTSSPNDSDTDEKLDHDLHILEQKTDAMLDALHRNYARTELLQKENETLKDRVSRLKTQLQQQQQHSTFPSSSPTHFVEEERDTLCRQRLYPPVPKTTGTMFVMELVEFIDLDVGHHAYLAWLMDKQWAKGYKINS